MDGEKDVQSVPPKTWQLRNLEHQVDSPFFGRTDSWWDSRWNLDRGIYKDLDISVSLKDGPAVDIDPPGIRWPTPIVG